MMRLKKKTKRSQWLIEHKDTHTHKSIRVFKLDNIIDTLDLMDQFFPG